MVRYCRKCGTQLLDGTRFCMNCGAQLEQPAPSVQSPPTAPPPSMQRAPGAQLWYQNKYRIRKKVMTVGNKYWIEDHQQNILGFSKQKLLKLKEDIRIYSDESMTAELFRIQQEQIMDVWGTFAVIDSVTSTKLGFIKRGFLSEFGRDAWEVLNQHQQVIGRIFEQSLGRALARKYMPGGALIPEKMTLELNGQPIADINQQFKIVGDIWDMDCHHVPLDLDRRVLLSCIILMGSIERSRK
jgi:uncharacterized protein YxjI